MVDVTVCTYLFTLTVLGYVFQYITLEISSLALLDEVYVELEDGQNVKE